MEFLIITGMSGAGKSQAAKTLEDIGWYCIDNMPALLIPKFAEIYSLTPAGGGRVAFVVDIRGEVEFDTLFNRVDEMKGKGIDCRTVFIDCADNVIIDRYKYTRRTHPFVVSKNLSMGEALKLERSMLEVARKRAEYVIDTTKLVPAQLRDKMTAIGSTGAANDLLITCMSFGFKYGAAVEADLVFDVRCFPNPYYEPALKPLSGLDAPVRDFVFAHEETQIFCQKLYDMVDYLLPLYQKEGKTQLTIGIGCTGGRHRSTAICEALAKHIREKNYHVITIHRDITK